MRLAPLSEESALIPSQHDARPSAGSYSMHGTDRHRLCGPAARRLQRGSWSPSPPAAVSTSTPAGGSSLPQSARGPEAVLPRTAPRVSAERRRATSLPSCVSNAQPVTVMRPPRSAKTAVRTLRKVVPRASREHSASQICTADDAVEMVQSTSSSRAPGCGEVHFSTHTRWLGEGEALLRDCARGRAA